MRRALLSPTELLLKLADLEVIILDCRFSLADSSAGAAAYEIGHIPRSIYVHLNHDLSGEIIPGTTGRHPLPKLEVFVDKLRSWGISNDTTVIAYDDFHGAFASRFWWMMKWLGHEDVYIINGGWNRWLDEGLPISASVSQGKIGNFEPKIHEDMVVDAQFVVDNIGNDEMILVDARAEERYRGIKESIDPVAGHIPGAVNVPFLGSTDSDHIWSIPKALKKRFDFLSDYPADKQIFYCGSGVSACHNIVSMYEAGFTIPKLYAGSWSEWITDKDRPIDVIGKT